MEQTLVVQDGEAVYRLHTITTDEAAAVGCDGATHKYVGTYSTVYGQWRETTRKVVSPRRRYWSAMRGVHGRWFGYGDTGAAFSGWAV
jgi:hypothetical protein